VLRVADLITKRGSDVRTKATVLAVKRRFGF